ncbi:MAG: SMC-Scp complex subunit ScpB [Candidatus Aenigmarchaeota archaeon]|nr:SMC-Scp complex subunit ScpB [Candidatus Aenigmarchaeota archaeon]
MAGDKKALIEAALFMSPDPISLNNLSKITGISSKSKLKGILSEIEEHHRIDTKGVELALSPEGYHFRVKKPYLDKVSPLTPHSDLTDGMLRTLGLVALRQPLKQSIIVKIQGNKVYNYIKKLEDKGLIETQKAGRTKVLRTTKEFETYFGKSLKDIQQNLKAVVSDEAYNQLGIEVPDEETKGETERFEDSENQAN